MKKIMLSLVIMIVSGGIATAQDQIAIRKKNFNLDDGKAIQGYDPVAYYTENKAVKGSRDQAIYHQGATYYFSSAANK